MIKILKKKKAKHFPDIPNFLASLARHTKAHLSSPIKIPDKRAAGTRVKNRDEKPKETVPARFTPLTCRPFSLLSPRHGVTEGVLQLERGCDDKQHLVPPIMR